MSMSWWKTARPPKKTRGRRLAACRRRKPAPRLEALEERCLPSVSVQVFDDNVPVVMTLNGGVFSGTSAHFSLTLVGGDSNSPGGTLAFLQMTPQSTVQVNAPGAHTLTVEMSDNGFTAPAGTPLTLSSG